MTEEWIDYDDLKKKYFYNKNKIINSLLQKGFQPYDANGDPVYCPDEYHKFSYLDKKRRKERRIK